MRPRPRTYEAASRIWAVCAHFQREENGNTSERFLSAIGIAMLAIVCNQWASAPVSPSDSIRQADAAHDPAADVVETLQPTSETEETDKAPHPASKQHSQGSVRSPGLAPYVLAALSSLILVRGKSLWMSTGRTFNFGAHADPRSFWLASPRSSVLPWSTRNDLLLGDGGRQARTSHLDGSRCMCGGSVFL